MSRIERASCVAHRPNPRDPAKMIDPSHRGMRVAPAHLVRGLSATLCVLSMGCLITDDIEFPEEPFCPPAITSPVNADNPLNEIARVTLGEAAGEDAGTGMRQETFTVVVWDCNVDQELNYVALVDSLPELGRPLGVAQADGTLSAEARTTQRELSFSFTQTQLSATIGEDCHKIELFVSERFVNTNEPARPGDLATATWWMIVDDPATMEVPSCR